MIGVITLPNFMYYNYGGVLQNYALVQYLKNNNLDVQAIHCNANTLLGAGRMWFYDKFNIRILKENGKLSISWVDSLIRKRNANFDEFINTNISPRYYSWYSEKVYSEINEMFDRVIIGSDQVWNPFWAVNDKTSKTFLLTFLPPHKRISYAASFGVDELPEYAKGVFQSALEGYSSISVREDAGAKIVKELLDYEVPIVLDPTMLLTVDDWRKVSKKTKLKTAKPYILKYFLGEQNNEKYEYIENVAKKNGLCVFELSNKKYPEQYVAGPAEFLDLFDNAELVFTDSFHATVFSILFGKPFVVYNRVQNGMENMGSRIDTLLGKLKLENRLPKNVKDSELFWCDYDNAYEIIDVERAKSKEYIIEACNR